MQPRAFAFVFAAVFMATAACFSPPPQAHEDAGTVARPPDAGDPEEMPDGGSTDSGVTIRRITALTVTPASLDLAVGNVSGVTAMATFSDGTTSDVTGTVHWIAEPPDVIQVEVDDTLARVETLKAGTATLKAKTGSVISNTIPVMVTEPDTTPREFRAVWVTRFAFTNKASVQAIINRAADAGFNVVFFQIRGNGDAYYKSNLVPWAQRLTGTLGRDPGWDPLQVAIDAAHARGIQLHAYWNVFAGWPTPAGCSSTTCTCQPEQGHSDSCTLPPASPVGMPNHVLHDHPDWMAVTSNGKSVDTEYYWLSPGNPAVRQHILEAAEELITHYDIDGLHLDRIRYPGSSYSYDAVSNAEYAALPAENKPSRPDWQRDNVSKTVAGIYQLLKENRPNAILSASVWGIYKKLPGCNTSEGYSGYYQDSIAWMKEGQIDALVPMIYWDIGTGCTDWATLLDGFLAGSNGRPIIAGMHAIDGNAPKFDRIRARIDYARTVGAAGTSIFASTYLDAKTSGSPTWPEQWSQFVAPGGPYAEPAEVPEIDWR
ncbi:MAG: family 10 glycosylhydrolase [Myxococcaceae bacterium]|nr:family 10 glycosylhydrolase [Myxococcaceae bacterium]